MKHFQHESFYRGLLLDPLLTDLCKYHKEPAYQGTNYSRQDSTP